MLDLAGILVECQAGHVRAVVVAEEGALGAWGAAEVTLGVTLLGEPFLQHCIDTCAFAIRHRYSLFKSFRCSRMTASRSASAAPPVKSNLQSLQLWNVVRQSSQ